MARGVVHCYFLRPFCLFPLPRNVFIVGVVASCRTISGIANRNTCAHCRPSITPQNKRHRVNRKAPTKGRRALCKKTNRLRVGCPLTLSSTSNCLLRVNPCGFQPKTKYMSRLSAAGCDIPPTTYNACLLYTSPSPRDKRQSRMPSSA